MRKENMEEIASQLAKYKHQPQQEHCHCLVTTFYDHHHFYYYSPHNPSWLRIILSLPCWVFICRLVSNLPDGIDDNCDDIKDGGDNDRIKDMIRTMMVMIILRIVAMILRHDLMMRIVTNKIVVIIMHTACNDRQYISWLYKNIKTRALYIRYALL